MKKKVSVQVNDEEIGESNGEMATNFMKTMIGGVGGLLYRKL